jgi:hypothetical protein
LRWRRANLLDRLLTRINTRSLTAASLAESSSRPPNVIDLAVHREGKDLVPAPPPQPQPQSPWHVHEATWVLLNIALLEEDFLNAWETGFILDMAIYLKRIADKVERALAKQFLPTPPDGTA